MNDLKMIENELVPVYTTDTGEKVVYGTELYECIGSKRQYTDWIKSRLIECDAVENEDYHSFSQNNEKPNGGRPKQEYIIKLDTAKEMAMLERNEKGKQVRRYFIEVEKKYQQQALDASELSPQTQAIINLELWQKQIATKIEEVNADLQEFKQEMPILGVEEVKITNAVKKKGVECLGGKSAAAYGDRSLRSKLYADIYRQLKREFGVTSYKGNPTRAMRPRNRDCPAVHNALCDRRGCNQSQRSDRNLKEPGSGGKPAPFFNPLNLAESLQALYLISCPFLSRPFRFSVPLNPS